MEQLLEHRLGKSTPFLRSSSKASASRLRLADGPAARLSAGDIATHEMPLERSVHAAAVFIPDLIDRQHARRYSKLGPPAQR